MSEIDTIIVAVPTGIAAASVQVIGDTWPGILQVIVIECQGLIVVNRIGLLRHDIQYSNQGTKQK